MSDTKYTTNSATSKNWIDHVGSIGASLVLGALAFNGGLSISIANHDTHYQVIKSVTAKQVDYNDNYTSFELMKITESSLAKYWDTPEEDEAWRDM